MKDFEDALLEISWNNFSTENQRYKDMDTKAAGIITICGVLATLLIGFGSVDGITESNIYFAAVFALLLAAAFAVYVLKPIEVDGFRTQNIIDDITKAKRGEHISGIIATVSKCESSLIEANNTKALRITLSVYSLAVAVMLILIYSFLPFFG